MRNKCCSSMVIAIDGMSAAYKTTVSDILCDMLGASVIHCDDFFLPVDMRTEERLKQPGGNIHYERLKEEVVDNLRSGKGIEYRKFSCRTMDYEGSVWVPPGDVYIVEGAYALHPYLEKYYDMAVFMKVEPEVQLERIRKRNGDITGFQNRWIPMEMNYIREYGIEAKADIIADTTRCSGEAAARMIRDRIIK